MTEHVGAWIIRNNKWRLGFKSESNSSFPSRPIQIGSNDEQRRKALAVIEAKRQNQMTIYNAKMLRDQAAQVME